MFSYLRYRWRKGGIVITQQLLEGEIEEVQIPLFIKGRWIRFKEDVPFAGRKFVKGEAPCSVILGVKGGGKSSLSENIATHFSDPLKHPSKTGKILDFFGSRDNEGLAWCRSPYVDDILFICGDNTDIACSYPFKHIKDVKLSDFRQYKVILTVSAFFSRLREEHHFFQIIMDKLRHRTSWGIPDALIIREAANLIFSRISLKENQAQAKAYIIYMLREARHCGYAVCADAIRFKSVDIDLRSIADYSFIKAVGVYGLPGELKFLYKYFDAYSIMRMPVQRYILLSKRGSIARGYFEYPPWHKQEKEDMLKMFDIEIEHGEPIDYADKGFKRISDFEHEKIVMLRHEGGEEGIPFPHHKIARQLKRSSATIWKMINEHNKAVRSVGVCSICKRVRCSLQNVEV